MRDCRERQSYFYPKVYLRYIIGEMYGEGIIRKQKKNDLRVYVQ